MIIGHVFPIQKTNQGGRGVIISAGILYSIITIPMLIGTIFIVMVEVSDHVGLFILNFEFLKNNNFRRKLLFLKNRKIRLYQKIREILKNFQKVTCAD